MADKAEKKRKDDSIFDVELADFMDVPYEITIVIGRRQLKIGELLQLEYGSIVELPKSAGESFDVLANGKPIAKGEITIMEDRFGVRVIEFLTPS